MKTFPRKKGQLHPYYQNEIRFSNLKHPHVTKNLHFEHERTTKTGEGVVSKVSYKIMEYAPFGDFLDFMKKNGRSMDEKLARTYFRQLIDGLEYLHNNEVSHMDIKLENLLIGDDYALKIADFDLSHRANDAKIISKGTKFYRAPELIQGKCKNTTLADIYSAGVVLFAFKSQGNLPHAENSLVKGVNFAHLLHNNDPNFWKQYCRTEEKDESLFDEDFKELFHAMTHVDLEKRATIDTIKKSKWFNGPYYSKEELKDRMNRVFWQ